MVELMVVLALLSLMLALSGVGAAMLQVPREAGRVEQLRRARAEAIRTGRRVPAPPGEATAPGSQLPAPVFLPDGRALGPGVDPLTGAPR